jgi:hypothetical protein
MSDARTGAIAPPRVAVGIIVAVLLVTGPIGVSVTGEPDTLGDGTATVTVLEPGSDALSITDGRFGTEVSYVRIPDLVVDVESVSGQPRLLYVVRVPALGLDEDNSRLVRSTGRLRVPLRDRAIDQEVSGTYSGRLVVRVQSFSGMQTVSNRSIEVRVE